MTLAAFAEVRLDDNLIVYHMSGGPVFSTSVIATNSGRESRNVTWLYHLGKWDLGERDMLPSDFRVMQAFFNARRGRAQGFRAKIWNDYLDEGNGVLVPVLGSTTTFQMSKTYTSGSDVYTRPIFKPVAGNAIYRNGTLDSGATYDTTTGIVTPTTTTGTLTWKGSFDTPVRFDADAIQYEFIGAQIKILGQVTDAYFHLHSLPLQEIRL